MSPYNKTIIERLREKFTEPEFKCEACYSHSYDAGKDNYVPYYIVSVKWDINPKQSKTDECKCILF